MSDAFDITTVIFALLALFVLFKLRSVLGARTGTERPPFDPFNRPKPDESKIAPPAPAGNVINLPGAALPAAAAEKPAAASNSWDAFAEKQAWPGLTDISGADGSFSAPGFLNGAKSAYETIVCAFAGGDLKILAPLLATDVYDGFQGAISARESRGEKIETTFVSIEKAVITDAQLRGSAAQVTVRFLSKLITATRDREKKIIDGNPEKVADITDVWTFARDAKSRDPNWKLIATETAH